VKMASLRLWEKLRMKPNPCKVCGSNDLVPRFYSHVGAEWIMCDNCGNTSSPVTSGNRDDIVAKWNEENEQ